MNFGPYDNDQYADIRTSVRKLCAEVSRRLLAETRRGACVPNRRFVRARTEAGLSCPCH